jgi:cardiolipin synthase
MRTNLFRRLHRKIVAVDGTVAFIGGINFSADHLLSFGMEAKQDYAVRIEGPLARHIGDFARQQSADVDHPRWSMTRASSQYQPSRTSTLVVRDNGKHRSDIERNYRAAIRGAKREIVIACAYFFPGYKLLRQLRHAARRGVVVRLILQGAPDVPQVKFLATTLYPSLLESGVEIHEYYQRPLHAKVAVIDDDWATIGSSNLDPLSLALNLEANVVIRDAAFNRHLRGRLEPLLQNHCKQIDKAVIRRGSLWLLLCNFMAYHCTRHFPRWAGWLPAHLPQLHSIAQQHPAQPGVIGRRLGIVGDDGRY